MKNFLGISNVVDAQPIFGKDGIVDGFDVYYETSKNIKVGKKILTKTNIAKRTVWVREFDQNSIASDGTLHGFGKGAILTSKNSRKVSERKAKLNDALIKVVKNRSCYEY